MLENQRKEEAFDRELKTVLDDPTQLYLDPRFGERKLQSLNFRQSKNRTFNNHFKTLQNLYKQAQPNPQKAEGNKTDPFVDYVEKTSKPGSRKR